MECSLATLFTKCANISIIADPTPQAIDLNALLDQVITLQAPDLRDKRIVINRELNPDLPLAFADKAQIQQVLFNLMADACEAISRSERPKELTIRTSFSTITCASKSRITAVGSPI
jgi:signal transduction histidine kinase